MQLSLNSDIIVIEVIVMAIKDINGQRFGRLKVLEFSHLDRFNKAQWRCLCDCGNETIVASAALRRGNTKSCGCYRKEIEKIASVTHGMTKENGKVSVLYSRWLDMKKRCNNEKNKEYKNYGARGIKVCREWEYDYPSFHKWAVENGFDETLTLDRKDVNKGYSPGNCRWVTITEQAKNKRVNPKNKTGVSGVVFKSERQKYNVRIGVNGKRIYVGDYDTIEEAVEARRLAEVRYWG